VTDFERLLGALTAGAVDYILVGGLAASYWAAKSCRAYNSR
jgi:hypothetical protein